MTGPRVSIVTPSLNQGSFIRATIESVLSQDYASIEYVVMDGGSTDETESIVREYASRLIWRSERDRGQAHAINKGFALATGEILAWLNSDDLLLPGAVTRAVGAFGEAPRAGAVYGDGYLIDRDGRVTGRFPATERFNLWKLVHLSDYVLQQSAFFRRSAVEAVGGLDESLHYALDWDLLIRLGKKFGLYYCASDLGMLREYAEAKTFAGGARRIQEIRRVLEKHTGRKRAPGYWIYALDAFHRAWRGRVSRYLPASLRPLVTLLHWPVYLPCAIVVGYILETSQGLSPEWWASKRLKWMLPAGRGEVVICGRMCDGLAGRGLVLRAVTPDEELGRWEIRDVDFEVRFEASSEGPLSFELLSSRTCRRPVPRVLARRKVSFHVRSISWADGADGETARSD